MDKNLEKLSDHALVELFKDGDSEAFGIIIKRHTKALRLQFNRILQDKVSIDDYLQDTFIKGMVSIQNGMYQNTGSLAGWLYVIGHNMIMNQHRRNERYPLKLIPSNDTEPEKKSFFETFVESELSPEDERIAHELVYETADIMELLDDLPHEQKEVLLLRYYHNLKFNEIVTYLGLNENSEQGDRISTPRVRALLAIKKLQGMVQKRKINTR